jgi:hypothetical protein
LALESKHGRADVGLATLLWPAFWFGGWFGILTPAEVVCGGGMFAQEESHFGAFQE